MRESSVWSMEKQMEAHLHEESKLWSFVVLCQSQSRKQREKFNMKKFKRRVAAGHISSTSWNPFYTYYILFRSLGSQESNTSNGVQIRDEMKKLWPLEDNRTKLKDNFASCEITNSTCENQSSTCEMDNFNVMFQLAKSTYVISYICNRPF